MPFHLVRVARQVAKLEAPFPKIVPSSAELWYRPRPVAVNPTAPSPSLQHRQQQPVARPQPPQVQPAVVPRNQQMVVRPKLRPNLLSLVSRQRDFYAAQPIPAGAKIGDIQAAVRRKLYMLSVPGKPVLLAEGSQPFVWADERKERHRAFLGAIQQRHKQLLDTKGERRQMLAALMKQIVTKGREREFRILKSLKEKNWKEYMDSLKTMKDERVAMIFEQTTNCLKQLVSGLSKSHARIFGPNFESSDPSAAVEWIRQSMLMYGERVDVPQKMGGDLLKSYQKIGFQWLASLHHHRMNGILADEMGLGKTLQVITFLRHLKEKGVNGPHLVVCPTMVVSTWMAEFEKWDEDIDVVSWTADVAREDRPQYWKDHLKKAAVVVTSYDFVRDYGEKSKRTKGGARVPHLKQVKWHCLIVDEGHHIANEETQLAVSLRRFKTVFRLILTGTPLQNRLHELWSMLNFLLPDVFRSAEDFETWFASPFKGVGSKVEISADEQVVVIQRLQKVLEPFMLRRVKAQWANELPDILERTVRCHLTPYQMIMRRCVREGFLPFPPEAEGSKTKKTSSRRKDLDRKICNHPFLAYSEQGSKVPWDYFDTFNQDTFIRSSGKFVVLDAVLFKLLRAKTHKVLIFDPWTATMECLEKMFDYRGYTYKTITGGMKPEDRQYCVDEFINNADLHILLISTRAGGEGLNLQVADTVIRFEVDWNPMRDKQALARAHRHGQKKVVLYLTFVTVDEENLTAEQSKMTVSLQKKKMEARVLGAGDFGNQAGDEASRREELKREVEEDKGEEDAGTGGVQREDLDEIIARNEEELAFYRAMGSSSLEPLIEEHELPQWIRQPLRPSLTRQHRSASSSATNEWGRKRTRVDYTEYHSDDDDDDDDENDDERGSSTKKSARSVSRGDEDEEGVDDDDDDGGGDDDDGDNNDDEREDDDESGGVGGRGGGGTHDRDAGDDERRPPPFSKIRKINATVSRVVPPVPLPLVVEPPPPPPPGFGTEALFPIAGVELDEYYDDLVDPLEEVFF